MKAAMTDRELLNAYNKSADESAFSELVSRHIKMVHTVAFRILGDTHAAEDATQASFLLLTKKAYALSEREGVAGWLYRVAELTAREARRSRIRRERREQEAMMRQPSECETTWKNVQPFLDEAMMRLSMAHRETIVLRYFCDRSVKEISAEMNCTQSLVSMRLARALKSLQNHFRRRGVAVSTMALTGMLSIKSAAGIEVLLPRIQAVCHGKAAVSIVVTQMMEMTMKAVWMVKAKAVMMLLILLGGMAALPTFWLNVWAEEPAKPAAAKTDDLATQKNLPPYLRSLAWLAAQQQPDGRWMPYSEGAPVNVSEKIRTKDANSRLQEIQDVEATSLALLAIMGAGGSTKSGEYQETVRRGVEWLMSRQRPMGCVGPVSLTNTYHSALALAAVAEASNLADGGEPLCIEAAYSSVSYFMLNPAMNVYELRAMGYWSMALSTFRFACDGAPVHQASPKAIDRAMLSSALKEIQKRIDFAEEYETCAWSQQMDPNNFFFNARSDAEKEKIMEKEKKKLELMREKFPLSSTDKALLLVARNFCKAPQSKLIPKLRGDLIAVLPAEIQPDNLEALYFTAIGLFASQEWETFSKTWDQLTGKGEMAYPVEEARGVWALSDVRAAAYGILINQIAFRRRSVEEAGGTVGEGGTMRLSF